MDLQPNTLGSRALTKACFDARHADLPARAAILRHPIRGNCGDRTDKKTSRATDCSDCAHRCPPP
jgi:hypothetical protein